MIQPVMSVKFSRLQKPALALRRRLQDLRTQIVIVRRSLRTDAVEGLVGPLLRKEGRPGEFWNESRGETPEGREMGRLDGMVAEEGGQMRHASAYDADVHLDDPAAVV